ncbi:F0F1 ATP synthase subunit A [Planctomicrobium sp. SH664]|uniref:F0F1 ATP synthase subunit A n=1 Tax=Planctomicrobium sp. SH664 TaxID=3448125 RepID=UPI003F5B1466
MLAAHGTFHHVYDFQEFELPFGMKVHIPEFLGLPLTKFMLLQLIAVLLVFIIFRGLAKRGANGQPVNGWFWNFWEMLAVYLRDELVRPVIGDPHAHHEHDVGHGHQPNQVAASHTDAHEIVKHAKSGHPADKYLPFIWSCFFYILFCNLLGAFPWAGSATGNISMTAALALVAFAATYYYGAQQHGAVGFWAHLVPGIDAPGALKPILIGMLFVIEVAGLFIKHSVLAVRLFANIMGGHTALAAILTFIASASHHWSWGLVTFGSLVGQVGVGLLELLVAFIQAYVFAFLSTIFIAMSLHEH